MTQVVPLHVNLITEHVLSFRSGYAKPACIFVCKKEEKKLCRRINFRGWSSLF